MVYYRGYSSGTAKWNRCIGQGVGGWRGWHRASVPCPGKPPSQRIDVFSHLEAPRTLSFRSFVEVSLPRHDWWNLRPLVSELHLQLLSPPWMLVVGRKVPPCPPGHLVSIQKVFYHSWVSLRFLGALCWELAINTKYLFFIKIRKLVF